MEIRGCAWLVRGVCDVIQVWRVQPRFRLRGAEQRSGRPVRSLVDSGVGPVHGIVAGGGGRLGRCPDGGRRGKPGPHRTRQRCSGPVCDRPSASRPVPSQLSTERGPGPGRTGRDALGRSQTGPEQHWRVRWGPDVRVESPWVSPSRRQGYGGEGQAGENTGYLSWQVPLY